MANNEPARSAQTRSRGPAVGRSVEKAKNFKGTLVKLIKYMNTYKWQILVVVLFAIGSTIFAIVSPKLLGNITNQITDDYMEIKVYNEIHKQLPKDYKLQDGTTVKQLVDEMNQASKEQAEAQKAAIAKLPAEQQALATEKLEKATKKQQEQSAQLNDKMKSIPENQRERIMQLDLTKKPSMDFNGISQITLLLLGLYVLSSLFGYIQSWIVTGVTQKVAYRFRRELSSKINHMPLRYFDTHPFGDVLSRITNDVDMVSQSLSQVITQLIYSTATVIGIVVMMLSINVTMTSIILITIPLSAILISQVVGRSQKYFKQQQDVLGRLNGHIEETYAGHNIVKIFGGEHKAITKFDGYNERLYRSAWKSQFISGLIHPIMNFIGNLGYVAVTMLGGYLVINGRIRVGDVQTFIQYIQQFNQPIMQIANIFNVIQSTVAAAERVFEFIDQPDEVKTWEGKGVQLDHVSGKVEFDHIKFGYNKDQPIIHDFSASVKPGQKIAIVGPTGAGKTTMINLLMRFYDPDSGSIKIDGVDTKLIDRHDVRRNFGMVLQDTWLFRGTVRENLRYGKLDATDDEIRTAVKAARADHVIRALPEGYDTMLDENADNVSAGEKQLLTIARAMLANAPILILDEATSNVDTRTEELIQKAMDKLMEGRTSFVIAHRLSTIRNADLILVLNHGDIIEKGNHAQLMAQNGFYANLYNSQFSQ